MISFVVVGVECSGCSFARAVVLVDLEVLNGATG
jgi:hypothetical protein